MMNYNKINEEGYINAAKYFILFGDKVRIKDELEEEYKK